MTKQTYAGLGSVVGICAIVAATVYLTPGEPVEIKYEAPATLEAGRLGVIDVSATDADSFAYSVHPPTECRVYENGRVLVFVAPDGRDRIFVVAASKGGRVGLVEISVSVDGGIDPEPPGPESFADQLRRAVRAVGHESKDAELAGLIEAYETVLSMIGAGVIDEPEKIIDATHAQTQRAYGGNKAAWAKVAEIVNAYLQAQYDSGALETKEDHVREWRLIADTLTEAAK